MKSRYTVERMQVLDQIVAIPVGDKVAESGKHMVIQLNEEAMRILEILQEETTEQEVVAQLLSEYDSTEEEIAPLVHVFIDELRQNGLLEE